MAPNVPPGQPRLTTILVRNLHCPSCVTSIDKSLSALHPPPLSISTSIISQKVVISHSAALSASHIIRALEEVGFEVESDAPSVPEGGDIVVADEADDTGRRYARTIYQGLNPFGESRKHDAHERNTAHIERCNSCRAELYEGAASKSIDVPEKADTHLRPSASVKHSRNSLTSVVVEEPTSALARATVSIHGLSCSSCVGKITEALQSKPWIHSASVNLLASTAAVIFQDKQRIDEVLETVRSTGYGAELDECGVLNSGLSW